jgi:hypothetical protein
VIQKIRTRAAMKTLFAELENYAGSELDADYVLVEAWQLMKHKDGKWKIVSVYWSSKGTPK